jgi:N-acetylated-alpha-linked acidic dipeptidase
MLRRQVLFPLALLLVFVLTPSLRSQEPGIRGFTAASVAAERALEERYRQLPKPENLREYMRVTSAEPHHAGSPGSRKVAEYVLSQFKAWGLDAAIEEQEPERLQPGRDCARRWRSRRPPRR